MPFKQLQIRHANEICRIRRNLHRIPVLQYILLLIRHRLRPVAENRHLTGKHPPDNQILEPRIILHFINHQMLNIRPLRLPRQAVLQIQNRIHILIPQFPLLQRPPRQRLISLFLQKTIVENIKIHRLIHLPEFFDERNPLLLRQIPVQQRLDLVNKRLRHRIQPREQRNIRKLVIKQRNNLRF